MPFQVDDGISFEVGTVAAGNVGEVDIFMPCGVADGVLDGGGELVLELGVG